MSRVRYILITRSPLRRTRFRSEPGTPCSPAMTLEEKLGAIESPVGRRRALPEQMQAGARGASSAGCSNVHGRREHDAGAADRR